MIEYSFLLQFCKEATNGDECMITVFSPLRCRKGTKNSPSPYYDRDEFIKNEEERYKLNKLNSFLFTYGKTYEEAAKELGIEPKEEDQVSKDINVRKKEKPDKDCPILVHNISTDKYCVELISPKLDGKTKCYSKILNEGDVLYKEVSDEEYELSIKQWLPEPKANYAPPILMQLTLDTVCSIKNLSKNTEYVNTNNKFHNISIVD